MVVHERLRLAREARREDIGAVAKRSGVREHVLRALEDGRYGDLPSGIYGRTAVKAYAAAVGLPPDEVLAACEHLLPRGEDPLAGIARVRGFKARVDNRPQVAPEPETHRERGRGVSLPRLLLAASIDAGAIVGLLAAIVGITLVTIGARAGALGRAAPYAFGVVSAILGSCYFMMFAGVRGLTPGEAAAGLPPRSAARLGLHDVVRRAWRAATRDVWCIQQAGTAVAVNAGDRSSANSHRTPRAEQPARS